jgi:hypothetical protein
MLFDIDPNVYVSSTVLSVLSSSMVVFCPGPDNWHTIARHIAREMPWPLSYVRLPTHDLGSLNSIHLLRPAWRGHQPPDRPHFIGSVAGDPNVVVALENELEISNVKLGRLAELRKLAGIANDGVNKVVCELQDCLRTVSKGA